MLLADLFDKHLKFPGLCFVDGDDPPPPSGGDGNVSRETPPADGAPPPDPAAPPAPPAAAATPPAPPADPPTWKDQQINRQHRKIKELETQAARAAQLEAENRQLRELAEAAARRQPGDAPPAVPSAPAPASAPVDSRAPAPAQGPQDAIAVARFQIEMEGLRDRLNSAEYAPDWTVAAKNLEQMGGLPQDIMPSIFATDDPAYVVTQLGKNPEKFQEILDLPPNKRTAALVKIGMEKATKPAPKVPAPSAAPPPPAHLGGSGPGPAPPAGTVDLYNDKTPDDAWYAARMEQKRQSQGRVWSPGRRVA